MPRRKGRWVFVPAPKWETDPAYYSLRKSQIACQLYLRDLPPDLYDYCIANDVLPPQRLRKWRLEKWIEEHRTAAAAVLPIEQLKASRQGRGAVQTRRAIERMNFFRELARNGRAKIRLETF